MGKSTTLHVRGGKRVEGETVVQGAKNSALPLLAGVVLCSSECVLHNCPRLSDVDAACRILSCLGIKTKRENGAIIADPRNVTNTDVPDDLMQEMRSSIVFLGAILGRCGHCRLSFPGGCELGPRPIDLHLAALRKMGAVITDEHGTLDCRAPGGLTGAKINLSFASVGATENIILAAVGAKGETRIQNAAREPEIIDLANFLNAAGAKISGAGESEIIIEGVAKLGGAEHKVIPDRIAAMTYLCAAAITRGSVVLSGVDNGGLSSFIPIMEQIGCSVYTYGDDKIYLGARKVLTAAGKIRTDVYPGFPTDAQAPLMALAATLRGTTVFVENIFSNRYNHVPELTRMGAKIELEGKVAVTEGVSRLRGAVVRSPDLRGGAALVVAGLFADGETIVKNIHHIDRGYESIEETLRGMGADVVRK